MISDAEFRGAKREVLGEQTAGDLDQRIMGIDSRDPALADELYRDPDVLDRRHRLLGGESRRSKAAGEVLDWLTGDAARPGGAG